MLPSRWPLSASPRRSHAAAAFAAALVLGCTGKPAATAADDKAKSALPATAVAAGSDERSEDTPARFYAAWKRKLTAANEALAKNPNDAAAYVTRAALYFDRSAYQPAIDECKRALAADPDNAAALRLRANCQRQLGRLTEASADIHRALKLSPTDGRIVASYANFLRETGNLPLALTEALRAVELSRASAEPRNTLGLVFEKAEQFDKARASFDEATRLDLAYRFPYFSRGRIDVRVGQTAAALHEFDKVLELDPTHRGAYRERQAIYEKMGFPISAYHNGKMFEFTKAFHELKTKCGIVTLEVPAQEFHRQHPDMGKAPPEGQENWSVADTLLWACVGEELRINGQPVSYQMALTMLAEGADVSRVDPKTGNTLLHAGIEKNTSALILRLLLRNGADPKVKNLAGQTAADLLRQRLRDALPKIEVPATRAAVKTLADGLTPETLAATIEANFEPKVLQYLADANAQWAAIKEEKQEYEKFRARMNELGQGMIAMMASTRTPLDGVDPKEIGRVAARLGDNIPEFKSFAAMKMMSSLDAALWNARLCYGRDTPRYRAVVQRAGEIVAGKAN